MERSIALRPIRSRQPYEGPFAPTLCNLFTKVQTIPVAPSQPRPCETPSPPLQPVRLHPPCVTTREPLKRVGGRSVLPGVRLMQVRVRTACDGTLDPRGHPSSPPSPLAQSVEPTLCPRPPGPYEGPSAPTLCNHPPALLEG